MSKPSHLFIFLFLIFCFRSSGQNPVDQVQIKIYEFEEGLSHRDVYQITQDDYGFLWIATANGLNRFDSKNFLHIDRGKHIADKTITGLHKGMNDKLWLSLSDQLISLDLNSLQSESVELDSPYPAMTTSNTGTSNKGAFQFLEVNHFGKLYACTYDLASGLSHLQSINDEGRLKPLLTAKGNFEKRALCSWNQRMVFSYDVNTLLEVNEDGDIFHRYTFETEDSWIVSMENQGDSVLYALNNLGQIYTLKKGSTEFKKHDFSDIIASNAPYQSIHISDNGDIWVAGRNAIWWYQSSERKAYNFTKDIVDYVKHGVNFRQVYEDQTGVIWIASDFGLIKLTFPNQLFTTYLTDESGLCGENACSTRGMTEDNDGNIYVSFYNSIYVINPDRKRISPLLSNKSFSNPPFGILFHNDKIWTGNGRRIDLQSQQIDTLFDLPAVDLGAVILDHENEIWFGYRNHIFIYNTTNNRLEEQDRLAFSLDTTTLDISYLYQSPYDYTIWIGTLNSGLFQIDKYKGLLNHYDTKGANHHPLLHDKINGIYEDNKRQLWIATGNGLHQLDLETEQVSPYLPKDGLAHHFINGLLSEGDTVLWVSTDNGLSRFSMASQTATSFKISDGLTANEFNRMSAYKAKDGRMYFGGLHGINAFYPSDHFLKGVKKKEGKILMTQFSKLDGEKDSLINIKSGFRKQEPINISWQDRLFSFHFALANFDNPGSHQFSYKLDGLEKSWSTPTANNIARYNTIPHGDYTFRVRARTGNNDWNNDELAIPLHIQQAFYKTWWFLALCAGSIIGFIVLVARYRLHQEAERRIELQKEVRARTLDLEIAVRKSDELLLNILPAKIAEELKAKGKSKARRHEEVTVFFSDFKGFSLIAQQLTPEDLVAEIDYCFREFDKIMDKYQLEKIKTIGDAYMCAGGIGNDSANSAANVVKAALDIQDFMKELATQKQKNEEPFFEARIGVHTGPVVSGIVGIKKFAFDIWGDTVNIAARLEDNSEVGKVNISQTTYELVHAEFDCLHRGKISVKNLDDVDMYFVNRKPAGGVN